MSEKLLYSLEGMIRESYILVRIAAAFYRGHDQSIRDALRDVGRRDWQSVSLLLEDMTVRFRQEFDWKQDNVDDDFDESDYVAQTARAAKRLEAC